MLVNLTFDHFWVHLESRHGHELHLTFLALCTNSVAPGQSLDVLGIDLHAFSHPQNRGCGVQRGGQAMEQPNALSRIEKSARKVFPLFRVFEDYIPWEQEPHLSHLLLAESQKFRLKVGVSRVSRIHRVYKLETLKFFEPGCTSLPLVDD